MKSTVLMGFSCLSVLFLAVTDSDSLLLKGMVFVLSFTAIIGFAELSFFAIIGSSWQGAGSVSKDVEATGMQSRLYFFVAIGAASVRANNSQNSINH